MRGIVLNVFLFVWSITSIAQELDGWKSYTEGAIAQELFGEEKIFLLESSLKEIKSACTDCEILRSIDQNHHIVSGPIKGRREGIWNVNNQWKLNLQKSASQSLYYIATTSSFDPSILSRFKVLRKYASLNTYLIEASYKQVEKFLLGNQQVIHITNKVFRPSVESRVIDMNLNPNRVNKVHHSYPSLNGSTETVSIQENNFNVDDIDLIGRYLPSGLESEVVDNHATEMATIIAGAGNSFITGKGVADKAAIVSSDFFDAMPDEDEAYLELGINTQNHSYGINRANEYGIEARAFDQSAFNNMNLLHVFSSGNEGSEIASDGIYEGIAGYANLTGNIKMSKNSLVVGSVDTIGNIPSFVSRGPAYDGRIKPEVVAYSVVGSSNSAALVSGVSTLLQQEYREENAVGMPSALVKALLINSAEYVGSEGPNFVTGYGNVNAWRSLEALRNDRFYSGSVSDGVTDSFVLTIPANALNLKVSICWTDPPANLNDFQALVNNLDLRLVGSSSTTLPWILNANPDADDLAKPATRGVDELNNVEQVSVSNPETSYTVEIEGASVTGNQDFFVVWEYDMNDTFEWDFPTGSDNMPYNGETGSYFRWSTTKNGPATLSYSLDDINWIALEDAIDLSKGYWRWNNPPIVGDQIRARMEINGEMFDTEWFTVSEPLSAKVGFNCGDSLMLRWHPAPNASNYTIRNLGDETLEEYVITVDTFLVIPNKTSFSSRLFSIQPNLPEGKELLPTPTFDYAQQGIDCYVFSFFQRVALDTGIYLNLSLGTTAGIDRIVLERNNFSDFSEISVLTDAVDENYSYLDNSPNQGYNEHRATIYFVNGEELTLSAGTSFYLTEEPLRIFPNPIQAGESLSIITREFEDTTPVLEIIDDRGALIHKQEVEGSQDFIPTGGIRPGIYFYRLRADGQIYTGRILIR
ncbi:S8 family peptidase [Ekhidna sp. To15]|uniref:S8 family peptidase n=1 Tax=Ekhidna sp. To15 TaxID=3395267 RepID=UPI003F525E6F